MNVSFSSFYLLSCYNIYVVKHKRKRKLFSLLSFLHNARSQSNNYYGLKLNFPSSIHVYILTFPPRTHSLGVGSHESTARQRTSLKYRD